MNQWKMYRLSGDDFVVGDFGPVGYGWVQTLRQPNASRWAIVDEPSLVIVVWSHGWESPTVWRFTILVKEE